VQAGVAVEHVFMLDAIEIRRKGPKVSQAKLKITWSDFFCCASSRCYLPSSEPGLVRYGHSAVGREPASA
jgi:hypothetical protein